jgi:hypothetical protein
VVKKFRVLVAVFVSYTLLFHPASALAEKGYRGADVGFLVYSVGTIVRPMNFNFLYRKLPRDAEPKWNGSMSCDCMQRNWWSGVESYPKGIDYSGSESGFVIVEKLPPGHYEIYDFGMDGWNAVSTIHWSTKVPFSIPFEIESGKATYIGNFARGCWCARMPPSVANYLGYFVISDKSARDIAIARTKESAIPDVSVDVWDATKLNSPIFFARQPN